MELAEMERANVRPATGVLVLQPSRAQAGRRPASRSRRLFPLAVLGLLGLTLALRLWGIKQGLPYSYNVDEATHFVPRAIDFFSHNLDPHYFLNPPAYSYVLTGAFELWFGGADAATRAYVSDPTAVFVLARLVSALLGTLAVWLTYLAGARFFSRAAGLLGAAIFGFAFLPVFYSHLALNDVPALAPVALSLVGVAGVVRYGRWRDYLIAGAGIGLAAGTKYTGGITLACLLAATGSRGELSGRGVARALAQLAAGLLAALAAFTLANPYWILDFHAFTAGISQQASQTSGPEKLGTTAGGGIAYYLTTFTWGLGWVPAVSALAGALLLLARRAWRLAAVFIPAPILFVVLIGSEQRYFGRWLMPIFPLVSIVAAWAACELVRWVAARSRSGVPRVTALSLGGALVTAGLLAQSVIAVVHDDRVLSRPDTRNLVREWMVAHIPPGSKVVVEPVVPSAWFSDVGRSLGWTPNGERWYVYPTWVSNLGVDGRPLPHGRLRYVLVDQYERVLRPQLIASYEQRAFCWVVTGSLQSGRAYAQPRLAPGAIAYYRRLARDGTLVHRVSPYAAAARPVPFSFDFSIDYYPSAYRLPGPVMSVYRLHGGRCAS